MLVGKALIDYVRTNDHLNQTELAEGAGYVKTTSTGRTQVMVKQFYNALLAAQGLSIEVGKAPGKTAQYETTVHKSGIILLGKTYSKKFGIEPGDVLDIILEEDSIRLVPKAVPAAAKGKG
jgi:ABC-type lipoprotein release transport system permease subunit